jgi:hypothetical protein
MCYSKQLLTPDWPVAAAPAKGFHTKHCLASTTNNTKHKLNQAVSSLPC